MSAQNFIATASATNTVHSFEGKAGTDLFGIIERKDFHALVVTLTQSKLGLEQLDGNANTPLLFACYLGYHPFVKYLVECGADIGRINVFGQNALSLAAYSGDLTTCQYLIGLDSFETFNASSMCSPMCAAIIGGNIEMVKYLLKFDLVGIATYYQCQNASIHGVCPLKLAMLQQQTEMIELLTSMHKHHFVQQQQQQQLRQ